MRQGVSSCGVLWGVPRSLIVLVFPLLGLVAGCTTPETHDRPDPESLPPRGDTTAATNATTTTTATTAQGIVAGDGFEALEVLATVPVAREAGAGYRRDLFGDWVDADGDGCNTREEVLIRDSLGAAQVDTFGCTVVAGDWLSSYDEVTWSDPGDVDIDHVVALKEAWDSGAHAWPDLQRRAFANDLSDPRSLRAVTDSVNQSKGDRDPSNWMPPSRASWCGYLADWVAIKARWGLSMDESEAGRVRRLLAGECAGTRIGPWAPAPAG